MLTSGRARWHAVTPTGVTWLPRTINQRSDVKPWSRSIPASVTAVRDTDNHSSSAKPLMCSSPASVTRVPDSWRNFILGISRRTARPASPAWCHEARFVQLGDVSDPIVGNRTPFGIEVHQPVEQAQFRHRFVSIRNLSQMRGEVAVADVLNLSSQLRDLTSCLVLPVPLDGRR